MKSSSAKFWARLPFPEWIVGYSDPNQKIASFRVAGDSPAIGSFALDTLLECSDSNHVQIIFLKALMQFRVRDSWHKHANVEWPLGYWKGSSHACAEN